MKVELNERSSKILKMLVDKLDYPSEYVLRIAVFELARFMLGTPKEFVIFEKSEWDQTMAEARKQVDDYWKAHPEEARKKGIEVRESGKSNQGKSYV